MKWLEGHFSWSTAISYKSQMFHNPLYLTPLLRMTMLQHFEWRGYHVVKIHMSITLSFVSKRLNGVQAWYTDGGWRPASPTCAVTSKVKGQGRKVTWHVRQVLANKLRTKRPRNTKIGGKVVHLTCNNAHQFHGQRSRSPGRLMLKLEVRDIFRTRRRTNFKLGTHMIHIRRPASPTSAVTFKVARSRDTSDRCWLISRERNVLETPKLVGRLSTSRAIMHTTVKVKGQGYQAD